MGPLAAIRLRDVHPLDRTRVVPPSLEAVRQVPQICLQVLSIGRPGLSINARSRIAVQPVIRLAESVDIVDMVPERSQRLRVVPPRCLSYPVERTLQGAPALCPDPGLLSRLPLGQLPSLHGLRCFGLFSTPHRRSSLHIVQSLHRYYGTVRLPASVHHSRIPRGFAVRTWLRSARPDAGPPGSRTQCFRACQGSSTPPGRPIPRHIGVVRVAFRVLGARRHPKKRRFRGSIPCLHVPLSTLH